MKLLASLKTKFVVWVWKHTPSCAEISRLTSRALEQPPTFRARIKMRLHFVICAWCRRYFEQIQFLHEVAPRLELPFARLAGRGLTAEARQRIKHRLAAVSPDRM
jgi:hypothetical protein